MYDTTLRDGTQGEGFSLTVDDKLAVLRLLDAAGFTYVEGGWPGANPRDESFFQRAAHEPLRHARLAAFGSTRRKGVQPGDDPNLQALAASGAGIITIFGKTWRRQASIALGISPEENLTLISDSVTWLVARGLLVIFDAEHFLDGWKDDPEYAHAALKTAVQAGASRLVLCDTNGGSLPHEITEAISQVVAWSPVTVGIHAHNDSELAVANTLAAVQAGARHVQGTINGVGERCGNANLISVAANLTLKLGLDCGLDPSILTRLSRDVDRIADRPNRSEQPFVGQSAFAHKGGVHVSAVARDPSLYEHLPPERLGNARRVLVSDLAGKSNVLEQAARWGLGLQPDDPAVANSVRDLKRLEAEGYSFEGADASVQMLIRRAKGLPDYFQTTGLRVHSELEHCEASVFVRVGPVTEHCAALGDGPVNALDRALRQALERHYPSLKTLELTDYRVRVIEGSRGTRAIVRVWVQVTDGERQWQSVGAHRNILAASYTALADAYGFKLHLEGEPAPEVGKVAAG